jgi:transposase
MNTECPKCGCEDAHFDGIVYTCPACNYEWQADVEFEDEE